MPDDTPDSEDSGAQQRLDWFLGQRVHSLLNKDPIKDVDQELTPSDPASNSAPSLADLMRQYRRRLQDAADGLG
jgi:hypothetical protein